jgi:hypothetical protein
MKVIQVYKPLQDDKTKLEDLELVEFVTKTEDDFKNPGIITTKVEKKIPYWCVKSEMLKPNETYQEWLKRVEEKINTHSSFKEKGVEGIYFYDMQPIGGIIGKDMKPTGEVGIMVRYDYICRNSITGFERSNLENKIQNLKNLHGKK